MKVLAIIQAWNKNDPVRGFIVCWMQELARQINELTILTLEQQYDSNLKNIKIYSLGKKRPNKIFQRWRYLFRWHQQVRRIFKNSPPDIVFTHMTPLYSILIYPYVRWKKIPIYTWFLHPKNSITLRLAHILSTKVISALPTSYPYKKNKLICLGHGIDTALFKSNNVKPEYPPIILSVGRLSAIKNHPTIIKAAHLLHLRFKKPFRLIIIGDVGSEKDKAYYEQLQILVKKLKIQNIVEFRPSIPIDKLPKLYQRCTIHINATATGSFDKAALEAMACARLSIVTSKSFNTIIANLANQLMFKYQNADDLCVKIVQLLNKSDQEKADMGNKLRNRVIQLYDLQLLMKKLVKIFSNEQAN